MDIIVTETIGVGVEIYTNVMTVQIADYEVGLRQMLEAAQADTITATETITLTNNSQVILFIDPGGASRNVVLPVESVDNHGYLIFNTADVLTELLTVKDSIGTTITTITPGRSEWIVSGSTIWRPAYNHSFSTNIIVPSLCQGRLTLESGVAISTTDQADKTTLYFTPHNGNQVSIFDGAAWETYSFTELSLDISAFTASKPYDIFIYDNAGSPTLSGTVWTDGTTRATALTKQDGIYVKNGATNYRYIGTIYIDSGQKCQDTLSKRFVWNMYNRVGQTLYCKDTTDYWTYAAAAWRAANDNTTLGVGRVGAICGQPERIRVENSCMNSSGSSTSYPAVGIGVDSVSVNIAQTFGNFQNGYPTVAQAVYRGWLAVGYHFIQRLETQMVAATAYFYGDNGVASILGGMVAEMDM